MPAPRILVVDDNQSVSRFVASVLQPLGYSVRTCRDGAEALKAIAADPPDLVLLDLIMPRINGYQLIKIVEQKNLAPNTRFVLMSSAREQIAKKVMESTRVTESLPKPVRAGPLQELLQRLAPIGEDRAGAAEPEAGISFDIGEQEPPGEQVTEPEAGKVVDFRNEQVTEPRVEQPPEPPEQPLSLAGPGGDLSAEVTSDDAVRTREELVSLLRDRLDSTVAGALAEKLDEIMASQSRQQLLAVLAEVLASVIDDRLVRHMLELVKKHSKLV